jgi:acyl carrier protein
MVAGKVSADALLQLVRTFYVELHHVEPELDVVTLDSKLESDLGFDSLARVELLLRLEQCFHVHLSEAESVKWERVADLLGAINTAEPSLDRAPSVIQRP